MDKTKRIYILIGILLLLCIVTFAVNRLSSQQEEIKNSGEEILAISPDSVQRLAFTYDDVSLSFQRESDGSWVWDDDADFPVSEEQMARLLDVFSSFSASFIIENVEDYDQYGLNEPECTIEISTSDGDHTVTLGDFSKLDSLRYVSIGDGNAYLATEDPMDTYQVTIEDMIQHDEALSYKDIESVQFTGAENYRFTYSKKNTHSYCDDDVYFTEQGGDTVPLDIERVNTYLDSMKYLDLSDYVTYQADDEALATYGLDDPELSITVDYDYYDDETEFDVDDTYILHLSRSSKLRAELAEKDADSDDADSDDADEDESYVAYARVGDSRIIYEISSSEFEELMAVGYDNLRHDEVFTGDFDIVETMTVTLEGKKYKLTTEEDDDTLLWFYDGSEVDVDAVKTALTAIEASEFSDEAAKGQVELSLHLKLYHDNVSEVTITFYRHDGSNCLAVIDGETFGLVPREDVVALIEAFNAIVL